MALVLDNCNHWSRDRRWAIVECTFSVLEMILKMDGSYRFAFDGLPEDATIESLREHPTLQGVFQIVFHSQSFDPVPEGNITPTLTITATRIQAVSRGREFL